MSTGTAGGLLHWITGCGGSW